MKKTEIPQGFLWGGAVAAHQLEGGYDKGGYPFFISEMGTFHME